MGTKLEYLPAILNFFSIIDSIGKRKIAVLPSKFPAKERDEVMLESGVGVDRFTKQKHVEIGPPALLFHATGRVHYSP